MTAPQLVRHPAPKPTGSLFGYILNLSEKNGFDTPWQLFIRAQMKQSETRTAGIRVEKLARVSGRTLKELERIAYFTSDSYHRCRLLGHELVPEYLRLTKPMVCIYCAAEKGFIEAHWDLELMIGCPEHGCVALSNCPECHKPLSWFRRGLLECACGAKLSEANCPTISACEADLLDIIRRKVLGLEIGAASGSGLPFAHLSQLQLRPLLRLIYILGRHEAQVAFRSQQDIPHVLLRGVAQVLSDWPNNLFGLLNRTLAQNPESGTSLARGAFSSLYASLFKSKHMRPSADFDFLRKAFLDFVGRDPGHGVIDQRMLQRLGIKDAHRFITVTELTRRLHIHEKTARNLLDQERIPAITINSGLSERVLIDSSRIGLAPVMPGRVLREREAAAKIGIPVVLLKRLKNSGEYESNHLPRTMPGFHELDVNAFIEKVRGRRPAAESSALGPSEPVLTIKGALFKCGISGDRQLMLMRAVITGELGVVGEAGETVGDLLFLQQNFDEFVMSKFPNAHGDSLPSMQAAKVLKCDPDALPVLAEKGLIETVKTTTCVRVPQESIANFQKQYIPLAQLAPKLGTCPRTLRQYCQKNNIYMLLVPRRGSGEKAFVRPLDVKLVMKFKNDNLENRTFPEHAFGDTSGRFDHANRIADG